jgi:hypothetical protein
MSFELTYGPIAGNKFVLHKCDNRACVRPEHLFLGTHAENMIDMKLKGRSRRKLPLREMDRIKAAIVQGKSRNQLAREYSVSKSAINAAAKWDPWKPCRSTLWLAKVAKVRGAPC